MEHLNKIIGKAPSEGMLGDYIVSLAVERQRAQRILESLRVRPTRAMTRRKEIASGKTSNTKAKKIRESVLDEMAQNAGVSVAELEEMMQQMREEKKRDGKA